MAGNEDKENPRYHLGDMEPRTLLDHVLETMAGGVFTVDPKGKITTWNGAMEELTGYSADEALGRPCQFLEGDSCFGGPGASRHERCAIFSGNRVHHKPCRIRTRDGQVLTVLKNARLMRDGDGDLVGAIESITDVSPILDLEGEVERLRRLASGEPGSNRIVGNHPSILRLMDMIQVAGANDFPVLVQGETGTGKELVARAIHESSSRHGGPLVRVSCAALSETVLESELFGHVRGAFTGALSNRKGRFEEADGGTLLLDEIGDISPLVQTKLLRVLQENEFERVGDNRTIKVNIRVIAVTNRDLLKLSQTGEFRRDLYYRLAVIPITVPPLRGRSEDVPILAEFFIERLNRVLGRKVAGLSREALNRLLAHDWPGNVRELEHAIEYAFAVTSNGIVDVDALPTSVGAVSVDHTPLPRATPPPQPQRPVRNRQAVETALHQAGGKRVAAARLLGVSRVTLWKWMKHYGLVVDQSGDAQAKGAQSEE